MDRPRHRVSVKIALINKAGDRVLMTRTRNDGYGLPGGHVEYGETPEQALFRELHEELGIQTPEGVQKVDFWRDQRTERIILGYRAEFDEKTILQLDPNEVAGVYWASVADFDQGTAATVTYEAFIRKELAKST